MEHKFNIELATKLNDIPSAILIDNLYFWIMKNCANNKHLYDGRYWVYNSQNAWAKLFPYLTTRQVGYAIKKLLDEDIIMKGNYNKSNYDRTLWYSFSDNGITILQNYGYHFTKLSNGYDKIVTPIPDNKQDINTKENNNNMDIIIKENLNTTIKRFKKPTIEEIQKYCDERKNGICAERFYAYYESKGWVVGKAPMKDWKQAIITWEQNNKDKKKDEDVFVKNDVLDSLLENCILPF